MNLTQALDACKKSDNGSQAAISFPEGQLISVRNRRGVIRMVWAGNPDSQGGSLPGGHWVEGNAQEMYRNFVWRPAATEYSEGVTP